MSELKPIIGLEIHLQLNTKSKVFCDCSADIWEAKPNTHTCPVCLGLPGALPVLNRSALLSAVKMAQALNCTINKRTYFERKNYFYPDLPKGYQISQKRAPLGERGWVEIPSGKRIHIWEIHLEEDTAKSIHEEGTTLLDFNKSGLPLLEIVSAPEIDSVETLNQFAKEIREIAIALGISNCDMEKGEMRFEANVSIRDPQELKELGKEKNQVPGSVLEPGSGELPSFAGKQIISEDRERTAERGVLISPYRVEIKNLNSFKYLRDAVAYEIERQTKLIENSKEPEQETRGWDSTRGKTFVQRTKEEAHDYRYFPEPDLPPIGKDVVIQTEAIKLEVDLKKLPAAKRKRYREMGLKPSQAELLARDEKREEYFLELKEYIDVKDAAKLVINEPEVMEEDPEKVARNLEKKEEETISSKEKLEKIAKEVIEGNPQPVQDYQEENKNALQFLIGKVMQKTQGKADPKAAARILDKLLGS
ncbi:MAG: Asp-tRNA(Asn)/Glu-tRNA(Gln) amidotransferase subunit GatB [Patescibacteria group bacterium]|nr:Asp-tRNA(Asn)/Glu-tRNA(Gln) amidotransferase subunit GatB [Patescibacteria group bacterium]